MSKRSSGENARIRRFLADRDLSCESCNYNLHGISEGTCPECGQTLSLARLRERVLGPKPVAKPPPVAHTPEPWQLRYAKIRPWLWRFHVGAFVVNSAWIIWCNDFGLALVVTLLMGLIYVYGSVLLHFLNPAVRPPSVGRRRWFRLESDGAVALLPAMWFMPGFLGLLLRFVVR